MLLLSGVVCSQCQGRCVMQDEHMYNRLLIKTKSDILHKTSITLTQEETEGFYTPEEDDQQNREQVRNNTD